MKFNQELKEEIGTTPVSSFISSQKIQWFGGRVMRRNEEKIVRERCLNGNLREKDFM